MTKKEKAILKLAQKWARRHGCYIGGYSSYASDRSFTRAEVYNKCGRALLKILEGRDL